MRPLHTFLAVVVATRFLSFIGRLSIAPFYPQVAAHFGTGYTGMGILLSAFQLGYALTLFPAGLAADRLPPRRLVVAGLGMLGAGLMALFATRNWQVAAIIRFAMGTGFALLFGPLIKWVADHVPPGQMGWALAWNEVAVAGGMIFTLGALPLLATWVPVPTLHALAGAACLLVAAWVARLQPPAHNAHTRQRPVPVGALLDRRMLFLAGTFLAANFGLNVALGWLATYAQQHLGWGVRGAAALSTAMLLAHMALAPVAGRLTDRSGARAQVTVVGGAAAVAGYLLLNLTWPPAAFVGAVLLGASVPLAYVPLTATASALYGPQAAGSATALANTVGQLSGATAAAAVGWLLDHTGSFHTVWWVCAATSLLTCASAAGLVWGDRRRAAA